MGISADLDADELKGLADLKTVRKSPVRAGDGPPGNTLMWRGLSRLTDIEISYLLGAQNVGNQKD